MAVVIEEAEIQQINPFEFADEWGPEKIVYVYQPQCNLRGIVVIDNTSIGPAIGGIRMTTTVNTREVFRLARAMTWKNALAGIPHGGGKAGIIADGHHISMERKETLIRQFARGIESLTQYIPGPDMGTDETAMAWIRDEIRRSVGLSSALGGIPLDQVGATGFGLAVCAEACEPFVDFELRGARVCIQGFGNVGRHAARFLSAPKRGAVIVGVADIDGTIYDPNGLDVDALSDYMEREKTIRGFGDYELEPSEAIIAKECEIFVPAAQPDVITEENVDQLKCKLILQGANIPATPGAETMLFQRGIVSVPDFVANAGGVICGSVEYRGGTKSTAFVEIEEKIKENTSAVLELARRNKIDPRAAAMELAKRRVREAMSYRRKN